MSLISVRAPGKIGVVRPAPNNLIAGMSTKYDEHAAGEQVAGDARPDDVADARQLRADLRLDLAEQLASARWRARAGRSRFGTSARACMPALSSL